MPACCSVHTGLLAYVRLLVVLACFIGGGVKGNKNT